MTNNPVFEVKAPAPLAKMRETIIAPENIALVEGDIKARPLTKAQLKQVKKKKRELDKLLTKQHYHELKAQLDGLKDSYLSLKADLYNLPLIFVFDVKALLKKIAQVKKQVQALHTQLEPMRVPAGKLNRLNMRLKEHETAIANEKLYARLRREMAQEVKIYAQTIVEAWNRLGYCFDYTVEGKNHRNSVRFEYAIATEDEIQLKIKVSGLTLFRSVLNHLPSGVRVWDLVKPETLLELCAACERNVFSPHIDEHFTFRNGGWIVVERMGLTDGLFNYIELPHLIARYPQDRRDRFPLPLGVRRGRKINWIDLVQHPHLFVNGLTGSGKSNTIHVILSTLIQMHTPAELSLILIDLKEGAELLRYEDAPHTYGNVVTDLAQVHGLLYKLEALRRERMNEIRQLASDIDGYNALVPTDRKMRRVVVVFDEYQGIYTNRALGEEINDVVIQLATKARAAGIHLIIGTQSPYSDVVPKLVRANITCVLTGRQRTVSSSISTVGNKSATELIAIPGRMICDDGTDLFQVQMPYARPEDCTAAIQKAKDWSAVAPLKLPDDETVAEFIPVDPETAWRNRLIELSLDSLDGGLKARKLWELMDDSQLSQNKVTAMVKTIAGQGQIEFRGNCYDVVKQPGNFYKLILADTQLRTFVDVSIHASSQETTHETETEGDV